MISEEVLNKFSDEEKRIIKDIRICPPRREPWTEKDLRNLIKLTKVLFPAKNA